MENRQFPNPEGRINVLKRYLHILALLQYIPEGEKPERWNARTLADIIALEENISNPPDDSLIRNYIKKNIEEELDIAIDRHQGTSYTSIAEDIDKELQLKIAMIYSDFVIIDTSREAILKRFIEKMPDRALWTLARIYFAIVEKRMIQFDYITNTGYKINSWKLCPYYFIFRNNSLYLAVWDPKQKKKIPLLAERIRDLTVLDKSQSIDWKIPPPNELFRDSISAFITDGPPVEMKIRYTKKCQNAIESITSQLDPEISSSEENGWIESTFTITDYIYLCKQFVLYGDEVEILSPPEVRDAMVNMLRKSLKVYES